MLSKNILTFLEPIIKVCEAQFPKKCATCQKEYLNFKEFILKTKPIGKLQLLEKRKDPLELLSYVNCECGNTLLLSCLDEKTHLAFEKLLGEEALRTGQKREDLLIELRKEIRKRVSEK